MKFAQYLESNCTQEWKRAYIDYKRLKKAIKAVAIARAEREGQDVGSLPTKSPRSTRNDSFKGASAAAQRARVSEEASAGGDGRREHERNPDSSDADNDADEDSDDSDRIDQGPSAGHRHPDSPGFRQKVFKRSPSTRSGLRTDSLAPPRSNPGSPYLRSPRSPALSETPRPHYPAHTPSSRPRQDPSPPPELRLPDASALAGGSNQSNRRVAIGESTIISPDSSMDEHTVESASASERPSEDQAGQLNGSASPLPLLNGQELSGIPELHATPSTIRQGQNARSGTPSTRGSHSLKSPKIQAAIVSLRKATLGGTDPPASERLTAGAESPGSKKGERGAGSSAVRKMAYFRSEQTPGESVSLATLTNSGTVSTPRNWTFSTSWTGSTTRSTTSTVRASRTRRNAARSCATSSTSWLSIAESTTRRSRARTGIKGLSVCSPKGSAGPSGSAFPR